MAKYPNTFALAIKRIKQDALRIGSLEAAVKIVETTRDEAIQARRERDTERRDAIAERDETRKNFADLKERLLTAETEVARLNGYMQRVREDDNVADPLVEVEDECGRRQVSKRHPQQRCHADSSSMREYMTMGRDTEKRKHWTSY